MNNFFNEIWFSVEEYSAVLQKKFSSSFLMLPITAE
jgi:hypothetical protein